MTLAISGNSEFVTVKVVDDGRGIDTDKLVKKSLKNGILTQDEVKEMNQRDKLRLIFKDGLSTAESVSDVSGRGVGMAAVLQAVEESGGRLELESEVGAGTSFEFKLPIAT